MAVWESGRMWGREGPVVFRFALGRSAEVARGFWGDYAGLLQTDGYAGYNHVGELGMVHAGCWAHARRYFIDALKVHPRRWAGGGVYASNRRAICG